MNFFTFRDLPEEKEPNMSYAICHVICGYEVPQEFLNRATLLGLEDIEECFSDFYTSGGPAALYCGIEIGTFNECSNILAHELIPKITASLEQLAKAREEMAKTQETVTFYCQETELSAEEQEQLLNLLPTEPETRLMWGSS